MRKRTTAGGKRTTAGGERTTAGEETDDGRWGKGRRPVGKLRRCRSKPQTLPLADVQRRTELKGRGPVQQEDGTQRNKQTKKKPYSTSKRQCREAYSLLFFIKQNLTNLQP